MGIREDQYMQRKEQLLSIALDEFINKGYFGTSTREIAKIAGISSGLMFHYFASKQELYEVLIEIGCSEMVLEYEQDENPLKIFELHLKEILDLVTNNPFAAKMFVFMGDASYNAAKISQKAGDLLSQHDIVSQSIPLVKKGQQMGLIRQGNPKVLSLAFWCSLQGIVESIALNQDSPAPQAEWLLDIIKQPS